MRRALAVMALLVGLTACGKKDRPRFERRDDAAPVVVVKRTAGVRLEPEVEPNDTPESAMALPLPGGAAGSLAGETDIDRYVVTIDRASALRAEVSGVEGVDLMLEVAPLEGETVAICDNGPALVAEGVPNVPVSAGRYVVSVREFVPKRRKPGTEPRTGPSAGYELTVGLEDPATAMEREPNDTLDVAGTVVIGGEVEGYVGWRGDLDLWTVPLEGFGPDDGLDLDVEGVAPVELRVRIIDGRGATVLERRAGKGETVAIRGWMPGDAADARYAVAVDGKRSAFDRPYRLRAQRRMIAVDEESEPNDGPASATPLAAEPGSPAGTRRGQLGRGDVDYYRLPTVTEASVLTLSVDRAVTVSVVGVAGDLLAEPTREVADMRVGVSPGAVAFVVVARDGGDEDARVYALRWSLAPGLP